MSEATEKKYDVDNIADVGLDEGIRRLTPDRIQQTINAVIDAETGARLKAYVETCVHCGLCSDACHWYLSYDKEPRYTPVAKVKDTIWLILKKNGRLTPEEVRRMAVIAYTECNLCRRCQQFCPFGIEIAYMVALARRLCHRLGVTPQYQQDTCHSHAATYNQMWVKDDEWIDALQWQEEEARDEFPAIRVPLDKEGADVLYSVIAPEPKFRTQLVYQAMAIMQEAGVDWTMPTDPGWDNSNMAMFSGDLETMGYIVKRHFEMAQKLRVKRIVMGECGHAFRSVYDVGNRWLGWKHFPVPVIHAVEFYYEILSKGQIRVREKFPEVVSFNDPCNIVRGKGLHEMGREVTKAFCEGFVEMHPNREMNLCCAAGGGVINCGPPWKTKRVLGNKAKADQLSALVDKGVTTIVAPCHNCHGGLHDIIDYFKLPLKLKFLGDIIYEYMEKPGAVE